jgi:hypothetical protein
MAPKEPKITKQAAAGVTRDITLTIPETNEIIRKPLSAKGQSVIMAAYNRGLLTIYSIKKHKEKNYILELRSVQALIEKLQHLIIKHLTNSVGARLNKFYCTNTWS